VAQKLRREGASAALASWTRSAPETSAVDCGVPALRESQRRRPRFPHLRSGCSAESRHLSFTARNAGLLPMRKHPAPNAPPSLGLRTLRHGARRPDAAGESKSADAALE
jgi:hypothetical protein